MMEILIGTDGREGAARMFAQGLRHPNDQQFDVGGGLQVTNHGHEERDAFDGSTRNVLRVRPDSQVDVEMPR